MARTDEGMGMPAFGQEQTLFMPVLLALGPIAQRLALS
jgi:hypothetical protein